MPCTVWWDHRSCLSGCCLSSSPGLTGVRVHQRDMQDGRRPNPFSHGVQGPGDAWMPVPTASAGAARGVRYSNTAYTIFAPH